MLNSIFLDARDCVVTVTKEIKAGEDILFALNKEITKAVKASANIPVYHKAAIRKIKRGEPVFKYGEKIGCALINIEAGEHVHTHNLASKLGEGDAL